MNRHEEPGRGEERGADTQAGGKVADDVETGADSGPGARPVPIELETPTHRGDVIAALLCLGAGLAGYFVVVPREVYVPSRFAGTVNSPAFLPELLFLILAVLGVVYLAFSVTAWRRAATQGRARGGDWALAGGTALICAAYVAAINVLGMTLASACAVAATTFYFGERRLTVILPIALILPVALRYFFVDVAHIPLPVPWLDLPEWLVSTSVTPGPG